MADNLVAVKHGRRQVPAPGSLNGPLGERPGRLSARRISVQNYLAVTETGPPGHLPASFGENRAYELVHDKALGDAAADPLSSAGSLTSINAPVTIAPGYRAPRR
jgi:hypothetical protein